jgi:hypothetical protein
MEPAVWTPHNRDLPIQPGNMSDRELIRQVRRLYRHGPNAIRAHLRTIDAWDPHLGLRDEDLLDERSEEWRRLIQETNDRELEWKLPDMLKLDTAPCPLCGEPTLTPVNHHGDCHACAKDRMES